MSTTSNDGITREIEYIANLFNATTKYHGCRHQTFRGNRCHSTTTKVVEPSSTCDWRSDYNDYGSLQNKARIEARFTDIQFVMGSEDSRKTFHAHKSILACGSPVFETMFYGSLPEKRSVMEIFDDPEAFDMLLNYIYGKANKITSLVSAWKYFTIGDKYLIPKIQEAAKEYTSSVSLTDTTFWELIENNIFSSPIFLDKVNSYLMENKNNLIQSEKFLKVPESIVECVVQMDKLNVQEYQLLLAVSKWAYHNKSRITSKILAKYYKHIRFSALMNNEFFQFIDSYPKAIDAESVVEILRHLHNPSRCSLPKWCSTSKVSRIKEFQNHQGKIRGYCGSGYNYHPY